MTNMSYINKDLLQSELPLSIDSIESRGKRIIFVTNNKYMQSSALLWFFAMTGSLRFEETKYNQMTMTLSRKRSNGSFKKKKNLYYADIRGIGWSKFATTPEEIIDIFKAVGPDILRGEVSLDMFKDIVKNKRIKNKFIGALLLMQNYMSCIGNYLMCDILYLAKISPYRQLEDLSSKDIKRLYKCIITVCQLSYTQGGLTIGDFFNVYGEKGGYTALVYGRKKDDDGLKVTHEKFGPEPKGKTDSRRSIWYCKDVQI